MGVRVQFHRNAWWVFVAHNGRRRSKKVGDKQTAVEVARRIRQRLVGGELGLQTDEPTAPTVKDLAASWLAVGKVGWKPSTHRFYTFIVERYISPALGERRVDSMRRRCCREFVAQCKSKGLSISLLRGVCRTLSALLSQAVEDDILTANPAFRMGKFLRDVEVPVKSVQFLTAAETQTLLEVTLRTKPAFYPVILCAVRTGMRLGEYLALTWEDVQFTERAILVRKSRVGSRVSSPKNGKMRRVDMSRQLAEVLEALHAERRKEALRSGRPMPEYVFLSSEGRPLDGDNLRRRVFGALIHEAKVRRVRLHDLRHTNASLLIQNGESLKYVQEQLGHSSIQVTADIYGHLIPGANRSAVDRLDAPICIPGASGTGTDDEGSR